MSSINVLVPVLSAATENKVIFAQEVIVAAKFTFWSYSLELLEKRYLKELAK